MLPLPGSEEPVFRGKYFPSHIISYANLSSFRPPWPPVATVFSGKGASWESSARRQKALQGTIHCLVERIRVRAEAQTREEVPQKRMEALALASYKLLQKIASGIDEIRVSNEAIVSRLVGLFFSLPLYYLY